MNSLLSEASLSPGLVLAFYSAYIFSVLLKSSTHYSRTEVFINLLTFIELYFDGNPMG